MIDPIDTVTVVAATAHDGQGILEGIVPSVRARAAVRRRTPTVVDFK